MGIAIVFICLGILLFFFLRFVYYNQLKSHFKRKYNIDYFPKRVRIHKNYAPQNKNYYILKFPSWTYANKDGTRDKRRNNNLIRYPGCDLYVDKFHIIIKNPRLMIQYVNDLRRQDVLIEKNEYETKKTKKIYNDKRENMELDSLNKVVNSFKDNPYEFEKYCAKLYKSIGVEAENTPNSNDGGYDIVLHYENGDMGLVECKCYDKTKIGRPLIQKLVGANQTVGAKYLFFITTSTYSSSAKEYAKETGVKLIDGIQLLELIHTYNKTKNEEITVEDEWFLNDDDLKKYIPKDIYEVL